MSFDPALPQQNVPWKRCCSCDLNPPDMSEGVKQGCDPCFWAGSESGDNHIMLHHLPPSAHVFQCPPRLRPVGGPCNRQPTGALSGAKAAQHSTGRAAQTVARTQARHQVYGEAAETAAVQGVFSETACSGPLLLGGAPHSDALHRLAAHRLVHILAPLFVKLHLHSTSQQVCLLCVQTMTI